MALGSTSPSLTSREREIVSLVTYGLSAKEVAIRLSIAPCTVERHVENVRLKTRTRNRAHMVAFLLFNGLVAEHNPAPPTIQ
ncbi:helix-turn-helix transcriptional regulator [Novosphingobium resinovorum]|uniref:response regulator transcription factor n=1 Tax=Novosphingobium TaxID=165696 RepID=UPI001B3C7D43|nr:MULTISPECIES: helix-turn-helix transcriptional regulator [Novosphingobium]MBF7013792.1 helix-turn-helix transcriptional regulator [Novosphingobium sp. HR1a]WJM25935.1 helix-turn-helix transcriptional regulator [Novosphingobium resinovorum]